MLVTKLSTSLQQICQDRLFSGKRYTTIFNFGANRYASGNAMPISPEVNEFGTVGTHNYTSMLKAVTSLLLELF